MPESVNLMLADPQGRYVVVLVEGLHGYYLVQTGGDLRIQKIPWLCEIACGCLIDGRLYLVPLEQAKLAEVEPESGKTLKVHSPAGR